MEVYDPVHGLIRICPLAKKVIDTEEFQRLRTIKQLGCCYYVFPGASHNRFEHSIGVYHLSKQYMNILNRNEEFTERDITCISIAGLVHDIGHGPFSHLFDEIIPEHKNHEYRSGQLIILMNRKYNLGFTDEELNFMISVIYPKNIQDPKKYLYQIISNENGVDVDRFDYLSRDIKMIGLNYGIEFERIMNNSIIDKNEIIYSDKVRLNIEDYFNTRFIMYKEVYNHNTVRAIEHMVKECLCLSNDIFSIQDVVKNDIWEKFILFNDGMLDFPLLMKHKHPPRLIKLIQDIKKRNIHKCIGEIISTNNICATNEGSRLMDELSSRITENDILQDSIIVDTVKISYYGRSRCRYYANKNVHYQKTNIVNPFEDKDEFITKIFYKDETFKEEARDIYNSTVLLINHIFS